ncbi:hypothetical protein ACFX11_006624 [Malus domestica]
MCEPTETDTSIRALLPNSICFDLSTAESYHLPSAKLRIDFLELSKKCFSGSTSSGNLWFRDLHLSKPWILMSLYSGTVYIFNYQSQSTAKSFEVSDLPVRSAMWECQRRSRTSHGGAEKAIIVEKNHPILELGSPTSVRVKVKATSLNYANYLQILGKYQEKLPFPFIPGSDYSETVDVVGPAVSKFKFDDLVCSVATFGSFAQFIVADQEELFGVPERCDLVAAGALPFAFGTSHVALVHKANLSSSQVLLVLGTVGGVGLAAIQIGKVVGAIVIAVVRGAEKVKYLKQLGVDHVVDLSSENVILSVKDFLKSRKLKGVDVLYDPVGGKLTKEAMKVLSWGSNILVIGFASGEVIGAYLCNSVSLFLGIYLV